MTTRQMVSDPDQRIPESIGENPEIYLAWWYSGEPGGTISGWDFSSIAARLPHLYHGSRDDCSRDWARLLLEQQTQVQGFLFGRRPGVRRLDFGPKAAGHLSNANAIDSARQRGPAQVGDISLLRHGLVPTMIGGLAAGILLTLSIGIGLSVYFASWALFLAFLLGHGLRTGQFLIGHRYTVLGIVACLGLSLTALVSGIDSLLTK